MLPAQSTVSLDRSARGHRWPSRHQTLEVLGILMIADRGIAEQLLRGEPVDSAIAHPHYSVLLDDNARAAVSHLCTSTTTVDEFLAGFVEIVTAIKRETLEAYAAAEEGLALRP